MLRVFTYGRERLVAYLTLALKRRTIHLSEMTRRRVVAWPRGCHLARTRAYRNLPPSKKRCASPFLLSGDENLPRNCFHASAQGANNGDADSILSHWSRKSPTGPSIASRLSAAICQNLVYPCASVPGL